LFTAADKFHFSSSDKQIPLISFANIFFVTFCKFFLKSTTGSGTMGFVPQLVGERDFGEKLVFLGN
jgi:hypothetical protein